MTTTSIRVPKSQPTIAELRNRLDAEIERAEIGRDRIVDNVAVWGPLMIPLVPAGLTTAAIGVNYSKMLHFPDLASWPIGVVAGMGVEVFGIVANENYLDMERFNQTLAEGEERAPSEEARKARNTYVGIVVGLMLFLEVIPQIVSLISAPAIIATISVLLSLFPLVYLAVLTTQVIIMRKQHKQRRRRRQEAEDAAAEQAAAEARSTKFAEELAAIKAQLQAALDAQRAAEDQANHWRTQANDSARASAFWESKANAVLPAQPKAEPAPPGVSEGISANERRQRVLKLLAGTAKKSEANFAEWGRMFGSSDTTIRNDLKWLTEQNLWDAEAWALVGTQKPTS